MKTQCNLLGVPLIVGGTRVKFGEFPHQTEVGYARRGDELSAVKWYCGGSLISERFVLTAGHCITSGQGKPRYVRFGLITKLSYSSTDNIFSVEKTFVHPNFDSSTPSLYNDIGLLQLGGAVKFSETVKPACLNTEHILPFDTAVASGFGKTNFHDKTESIRLMKVTLDLIDSTTCAKLESSVVSSQICASVLAGGKDTCQGDSGGPLQVVLPHPICTYCIIGITSYGRQCGHANTPAMYTRVSYFIPWIVHTVWPALLVNSTLSAALAYKQKELQIEQIKNQKETFLSSWK